MFWTLHTAANTSKPALLQVKSRICCKSRYGLAKNLTLFGLATIAHNIAKGAKFQPDITVFEMSFW
jgi:hypothetical protein